MLEALRKGTGTWIAKFFIAMLVMSFAVWGVADIFGGYGAQTVASVGDTEISSQDYQIEFQREVRALSTRLGRNISFDDARSMALDKQILLRLIGDAAVENQANSLGLGITGSAVGARLKREAAFKDSEGNFSQERFYRLLQANGLSEQAFMQRQHRAFIMEQITGTVTSSSHVPKIMLDAANKFRNETRKLSYISVPLSALGDVEKSTPEKVRNYYNTHKSEFRAPEVRKVGVIILTPTAMAKNTKISEQDIKDYFEHNKARFNIPERRAVLQIPFPDKDSAEKAHQKLKDGTDFMEVAKERGLTKEDVDLGLIARTGLSDEAVADAVFSLGKDELSKPVAGALATVIAKVTKIEPAVVKTLEDMRKTITKGLAAEKASATILDAYDKIEDERAGGATLAEIGKKLDLKYVEILAIDRRGLDADGKPVDTLARQPGTLRAIFAAEVNLETDPEETTDRGFVWYEVQKITKERQKSFDEVKDDAAKKLHETEERTLLSKKGQELVDKLRGGEKLSDLALSLGVEVVESTAMKRSARDAQIPPAALQQAFALKEGAFGSSVAPDGKGRLIFKVVESKAPESLDAKGREALLKTVVPEVGDDLVVQYVRALREDLGVNINQTVLDEATSGRQYSGGRRGNGLF
jgi:peptidyl-prolyl cis-trans isomerase D